MRPVSPRPPSASTTPTGGIVCNDLVGCEEAGTLWGLLCERVRRTPTNVAYREYDPSAMAWREHTWRAVAARIDQFRAALGGEGLKLGDRVAILLPNGLDWVCFDMAAHALGLVVVALYAHDSPANNAYILGHSDVRLILVDTQARWQSLAAFRAQYPAVERVWIRDLPKMDTLASIPIAHSLVEALRADAPVPPAIPVAPASLATLIYTSGTTGRPKGVMLSHFALLWNAEATASVIPPRPDDVFLSVLPTAHAFERTLGYYLPMMAGSTVAYARSAQDLRDDLVVVRPTVLLGVPRLFERICAAVRANVGGDVVKQRLVDLAASLGWQRLEGGRHPGHPLSLRQRLLWPLLHHFVAAPVMAAFGGRLRVAVSGGAPLGAGTARFLTGLGLPLVEGYGLTEAAPVVTATALNEYVPGSAGRPLPGVDVKLTERGELLVRSPSMMMGYWKDEAATAQKLDATGWLSTGDAAELRDGQIFIAGRLEEMIVLSIGEKVNPNLIEAEITRDPLFEQAAVIGDGRPFLAALVVLNNVAWKLFAEETDAKQDQPNAPSNKIKVLARIAQILAGFPRHAQVRNVFLTLRPWTIDSGLLTPAFKVKRDVLRRVFANEIEELYAHCQTTQESTVVSREFTIRG